MKEYDVVIIGSNIAAFSIGTYLARHLRDVLIIDDNPNDDLSNESFQLIGGINENSLFRMMLRQYNIDSKINYRDVNVFSYYENNKNIKIVPTFKKYMLHLIKLFPNDREDIRKFFKDLKELFVNYYNMEKLRINNQPYTLPNILIEWGNKTLQEVMDSYFDNEDLINVFINISGTIGIDYEVIYAPHFFLNWFNIFIEGAGFIQESRQEIKQLLLNEYLEHNGKIMSVNKINKVKFNNDEIEHLEIKKGEIIKARSFVYSGNPIVFNEKYYLNSKLLTDEILDKYPNIGNKQRKKAVKITFDYSLSKVGIDNEVSLFDIPREVDVEHKENKLYITEILDASMFNNHTKNTVYINYMDYDGALNVEDEKVFLIEKLCRLFNKPSIKNHIIEFNFCKDIEYSSEYNREAIKKNKSLTELFDILNLNNIFILKNLYLVGGWNFPQMGFQAEMITSYIQGKKIETLLSDEDSKDLIGNDILISALAHEFNKSLMEKNYFTIQFLISNSEYYFIIEDKVVEVYEGTIKNMDLKITSTNKDLFNTIAGKESIEEMISNKKIEFIGSEEDINMFSKAFNLSQKSIYKYRNFEINTYRNHIGLKLLIISMFVWMTYSFSINFISVFYASIGALVLQIIYIYIRKKFDKLVIFDFISLLLIVGYGAFGFFYTTFNNSKEPDFIFLGLGIVWLLSWLVGYPFIFGYIKNDYPIEFSNTRLFKIISGGLTFIWGLMFILMFVLNLILSLPFQLIAYYIIFLAIYLTTYYPKAYIKSYISKG